MNKNNTRATLVMLPWHYKRVVVVFERCVSPKPPWYFQKC
jgi:hypothetical protein